jgi:hypothetical protein
MSEEVPVGVVADEPILGDPERDVKDGIVDVTHEPAGGFNLNNERAPKVISPMDFRVSALIVRHWEHYFQLAVASQHREFRELLLTDYTDVELGDRHG